MSFVINDKCKACKKCLEVCPVDCIMEAEIFYIDPDMCIECGKCLVECPHNAVLSEKYSNELGVK